MEGWIKLYRCTLDNPIVCKDGDYFAVWCYLLLKATHKEIDMVFNGKRITLNSGQLITGRKTISAKLNINESKVKRILICFESDQQIDRQRGNQSSLISILNWEKYQQDDQQNDQQVTSKWTANDQQVTTNKNVKNDKNERIKELKDIGGTKSPRPKKFIPPTLKQVIDYCNERNNTVDAERFIDFYSAKGWYIGKNKMKNWKAAVRTWERRQASKKTKDNDFREYGGDLI